MRWEVDDEDVAGERMEWGVGGWCDTPRRRCLHGSHWDFGRHGVFVNRLRGF